MSNEYESFLKLKPYIVELLPRPVTVIGGGSGGGVSQSALDAALSAHEAEINPHPIYLTQAEGDAYYSPLGHNHDDRYYTETESDAKYALKTRLISSSGLGLSGGGDLSADRTIALASSSNPGAAASVLATSASGALTLNNGGSTSQPALTIGDGTTGRMAIGSGGWLDDGTVLRTLGSRNFRVSTNTQTEILSDDIFLGNVSGTTTDFRGGIVTGTAWNIDVDGSVLFADNTNTAHYLGMAKIGYVGHSNAAGFGHRTSGATTYAFRQGASYSSYFNAGAGQWIYFRNGDVDQAILKPEGLQFEAGKYVKTNGYVSGFAGSGWNIDQNISFTGETFAEFDNLSVRGTMRIYELLINRLRATNGTEIVSSNGKIASVTGSTWEFEDPEGSNLCDFTDDDLVIIQKVDLNKTTLVKRIVRRITSVTGKSVTVTAAAGGPTDVGTPEKGDTVVRFGNSTDTSRQGVMLLTSDFANAPYMDVINGVASWADWTGGTKTKLRIGKTTGVTSVANEYGMVVGNGFTSNDQWIQATTSGISTNKINITSRNGTTLTISLQSDGDVFFGSDASAVATTSFAHFAVSQSYGGETMGVGDIVIGNKSAGHMMWDASTGRLNFRNNTTVQAYVDTSGQINAGAGSVILNSSGVNVAGGVVVLNGSGATVASTVTLNSSGITIPGETATYSDEPVVGGGEIGLALNSSAPTRLHIGKMEMLSYSVAFDDQNGKRDGAIIRVVPDSYSGTLYPGPFPEAYSGVLAVLTLEAQGRYGGFADSTYIRLEGGNRDNGSSNNIYAKADSIYLGGDVYVGASAAAAKFTVNFSTGVTNAGKDTDIVCAFGRAKIGYVGHGDYAAFAHYDLATTTDYGILHHAGGSLHLNCSADTNMFFKMANVILMKMNEDGLIVGGSSDPTSTLQVVGTAAVSGNTTVGGTFAATGAATLSSTLAVTGAVTLSSTLAVTGNTTMTGTLTASSNTDALHVLGRAKIGYAGLADAAVFAHFDYMTSGNYALQQASNGIVALNAASGQSIRLRIGNSGVGYISSLGLHIGAESAPSTALQVTGNGYINQASTTSGAPVLKFEQNDTDAPFWEFTGTVGSGNSLDTGVGGTQAGRVKIIVNGNTRYMPYFT